jgi:alkylation response protein AidB-like acyl-CoA dehydrogenase
MQFDLTETQQMLKNSAREFFPAECPITEVRRLMETETAYDRDLWRKLAAQGWTGIIFGEAYGGGDLGMVEMAAAMEEMGRALVPGPYLATVLLAGSALDAAGSEEQKQKYLAPICRGDARATLALLESGASWHPEAVAMTASATGNGYRLNGAKLFVPDAAVADFIVCAARAGSELALLVVDSQAKGLTITAEPAIDATRRLCQVSFDNVEVACPDVLATGARAQAALKRAIDVATVGLVAEMVGGMQKVLDLSVAYAKARHQFGKPIGQFQAVQHHCADMFVLTEASRSAAYYAAWAVQEQTPEAALAVSIAKVYASDACRDVGNRGIQVHGGMGFTWENDIHLYYRRAKASEICFGDAAFHRERIARLVLDRKPSSD